MTFISHVQESSPRREQVFIARFSVENNEENNKFGENLTRENVEYARKEQTQ